MGRTLPTPQPGQGHLPSALRPGRGGCTQHPRARHHAGTSTTNTQPGHGVPQAVIIREAWRNSSTVLLGQGDGSYKPWGKPQGRFPTHTGFELRVSPVPPVTPCPQHGAAGL